MDAFDKLQSDLAAEIDAHYERQKRAPVSMKIGPAGTLQTAAGATGREALSRVMFGRGYAFDGQSALEFGTLTTAAMQMKMNVVDTFDRMATTRYLTNDKWQLPNWRQTWRPEPVEIPPLPTDPITGQRVRNPWEEPHDFKSQNMVKEWSPRLAQWLEDCVKNHGVTVGMLDKLEAEKLEAAALFKVPYGLDDWMNNRLRRDIEPNLTFRGEFAKSIADPWALHAHREEEKLGSPRAVLTNHTFLNALAKRDQRLADVHKLARQIYEQWQDEAKQKAA
jgi:hypothetical protein